ncbi:phosphotransferase [Kitasatospora sp. NPDC097643]|uniref:phosphotransferase n=1 Tax=Kitasatospora sp. NPDC097643 TaxID=3157230 RepID=UPI003321412F
MTSRTIAAVDEPQLRALLRAQHPDLADLPLRPVPGGWDHQMWRLGEELAVRLPRTARAPELLRKERRWLPLLAPHLPLPVPHPLREGAPTAEYPHPWSVTAWVAGVPGDHAEVTRPEAAADALAAFLRALHHTEPPTPAPHFTTSQRGGPLAAGEEQFERMIPTLGPAGLAAEAPAVRALWADAASAPLWPGPPVWLHADLHPANVVLADGTLAGVIDFGDLCTGDPATDLAAAWLLLPAAAIPRFLAAYGPLDPATVRRARGWALLRALVLIDIGRAGERGLPGGQPTWGPAGRATLTRLLADH